MKLRMSENSLFAVLLRSRWWISLLIALGVVLVARLLVPREYFLFAAFGALPFAVIAAIAARRQARVPGARRVAAVEQSVAAMSWKTFCDLLEQGFRRDGYEVTRLSIPEADLQLVKGGRTVLVCARRWKAARVGVEPLRALQRAARVREAQGCVHVAVAELSETADAFARQQGIQVLQAPELSILLRGLLPKA